jgi:hypothetical protein
MTSYLGTLFSENGDISLYSEQMGDREGKLNKRRNPILFHNCFPHRSHLNMKPSLLLGAVSALMLMPSFVHGSEEKKPEKPNIVFIFTDDQDFKLNSLDYMPNVQKHLVQEGTVYNNHYATIAVCCPSRVGLLRGQYAHNTKYVINTLLNLIIHTNMVDLKHYRCAVSFWRL